MRSQLERHRTARELQTQLPPHPLRVPRRAHLGVEAVGFAEVTHDSGFNSARSRAMRSMWPCALVSVQSRAAEGGSQPPLSGLSVVGRGPAAKLTLGFAQRVVPEADP